MELHSFLSDVNKSGGFTLVEVLAAVLLLSIGLLAVLTADRASDETQKRATYISIGRNIAQSKLEELRGESVEDISGTNNTSTDQNLPSGNKINVAVAPYPSGAEANLCRAVVTVTWPEGNGTRRICYETLIGRK